MGLALPLSSASLCLACPFPTHFFSISLPAKIPLKLMSNARSFAHPYLIRPTRKSSPLSNLVLLQHLKVDILLNLFFFLDSKLLNRDHSLFFSAYIEVSCLSHSRGSINADRMNNQWKCKQAHLSSWKFLQEILVSFRRNPVQWLKYLAYASLNIYEFIYASSMLAYF